MTFFATPSFFRHKKRLRRIEHLQNQGFILSELYFSPIGEGVFLQGFLSCDKIDCPHCTFLHIWLLFTSLYFYSPCVFALRLLYAFSSFILMRKCDILYLQSDSSSCYVRGFFLLSWQGHRNAKTLGGTILLCA